MALIDPGRAGVGNRGRQLMPRRKSKRVLLIAKEDPARLQVHKLDNMRKRHLKRLAQIEGPVEGLGKRVERLSRMLGGEITIVSELERGTTCTLRLPATLKSQQAEREKA